MGISLIEDAPISQMMMCQLDFRLTQRGRVVSISLNKGVPSSPRIM